MIDPFTTLLPSLNLHGETKDIAIVLLKDFIKDNVTLHNNKIVVIHGRSGNILLKAISDYLKTDKRVKKYYVDAYNNGQTIIELY